LADPNLVDVNWPLDYDTDTGDWFREVDPDPNHLVVNIIDSDTVEISWVTPEAADSNLVCTNVNNGVWWCHKRGNEWYCPDGGGYDATMVTDHNAIELTLYEPMVSGDKFEFKIRSTNDTNSPPDVNEQIIWGYIGTFEYE
jgi:hypothetical protein